MPDKYCFKRTSRLLNRPSFQAVFQAKKKRFGGCFVLYSQQNQLNYPRIGIILSKKQVRLACDRNRVRRIIRESFRHHRINLPNSDFVLVGLHRMQQLTSQEIVQCIEKQWQYFQQPYAIAS